MPEILTVFIGREINIIKKLSMHEFSKFFTKRMKLISSDKFIDLKKKASVKYDQLFYMNFISRRSGQDCPESRYLSYFSRYPPPTGILIAEMEILDIDE